MKPALLAAAAIGLVSASAASAGSIVFTGDTTNGPTWTRPVANGPNPPVPPPSGVGTATPYRFHQFAVSQSGSYSFNSVAAAGWDNYLFLYQNNFNPLSPFTNVLIGNDDNPTVGVSGFSFNLVAGTTYFVVNTGFDNVSFGQYRLTIDGPGNITAVPEPATWALMIGGFGLAGGALRVRRRNVAYA